MKKILVFLMGLVMSLSLSSCVTAVHAQDDTYFNGEVDAYIVITYGTPYIIDDMVQYYFYRGWYYYPYWYNNSYYFHRYRRALPPEHFRNWYRPIPRSYHHLTPPRHNYYSQPSHRPHNNRPPMHHNNKIGNTPHNRPHNMHSNRPAHSNNGHFGGHR